MYDIIYANLSRRIGPGNGFTRSVEDRKFFNLGTITFYIIMKVKIQNTNHETIQTMISFRISADILK